MNFNQKLKIFTTHDPKYKLILLSLFVGAILLRVWKFYKYTMFGHDTSRDVIVTYKMYALKEFPYQGPVFSVLWGYLSPLYYYFLFPFHFLLEFHPTASSFAASLMSLAALVAAVVISHRFFGKRAAIITGLICAVAVIFLRNAGSGLNPSMLPPFAIMFVYFLYGFTKSKKNSLIGLAFCLSFLLSFHPSGVFFLPTLFLLALYIRPKFSRKEILISFLVLAVLLAFPYYVQEKKMAWYTTRIILSFLKHGGGSGTDIIHRVLYFGDALFKNTAILLLGDVTKYYWVLPSIIYGFLIFNFAQAMLKVNKKNFNPKDILVITLFIYILSFFAAVSFEKDQINRLWFGACLIPVVTLYIGLLLAEFSTRKRYYTGLIILMVVTVFNLNEIYKFNGSSDSYSNRKEIADFIRKDSSGDNFDVYGSNPEPIYYIAWHDETDSVLKEKYFNWIKKTKKKDGKIGYMIVNPGVTDVSYASVGSHTDEHDVYTTSLGYRIIKVKITGSASLHP